MHTLLLCCGSGVWLCKYCRAWPSLKQRGHAGRRWDAVREGHLWEDCRSKPFPQGASGSQYFLQAAEAGSIAGGCLSQECQPQEWRLEADAAHPSQAAGAGRR